jgi:hypothetical protein
MTSSRTATMGQPADHESPALRRESPLPARSDRVTSEVGARLPRQALRETRADLLEAAVRIVNEYVRTDLPRDGDPPVDLLPFIRLDEVLEVATELARRRLVSEGRLKAHEQIAPLTPGAFYKAFTDEYRDGERGAALTSFRRLVTRKMVDDDLVSSADIYISMAKDLAAQGEPWTELARLGVQAEYDRWTATPALVLFSALALHTRDKEVREWTRELDDEQLEQLSSMYAALLKLYGLKLRPGLTVVHVAVAVFDLITGFSVNSRFEPEKRNDTVEVDVDGRGKRDWHLCALAAWGIYNSFLKPDS